MIDAWASWPHYRDHIQPIWDALPVKGTFWQPPQRPVGDGPIIVASHHDLRRVKPRPAIFVEHGAGQTYVDNRAPGGYAGGPDRGHVALFICPTEQVADLNARAYPQAETVQSGSARVEWLRRAVGSSPGVSQPPRRPAASFHWDCKVSPEARTAWPHYRDRDYTGWIGHGHPRIWSRLSRWWPTVGAEPVEDFVEVLSGASVYCVDNSSTLYEAAAVGVPVVILNAPWYRRDVWHGLRFWEHLPGPMVDTPDRLERAIEEAPEWYEDRRITSEAIYGDTDGAAERAAAAILELWG